MAKSRDTTSASILEGKTWPRPHHGVSKKSPTCDILSTSEYESQTDCLRAQLPTDFLPKTRHSVKPDNLLALSFPFQDSNMWRFKRRWPMSRHDTDGNTNEYPR